MSNCSSYIYAICHFALSWKGEKLLGWTFCGSAYCQFIHAQNTEKWLEWAERTCMMVLKTWCMWTNETTVQPVKVHVWSGVSGRGCTEICSFEGIMNAELYTCSRLVTVIQHDCHKFLCLNKLTDQYIKRESWLRKVTLYLKTYLILHVH